MEARRDSLGRRMNRVYQSRPVEERFWEKVDRSAECWLWTSSTDGRGYGTFGIASRTYRAHRVAWSLTYGPVPSDLCVLHHCDNPPCVRPDHLFLGDLKANAQDMVAKGRNRWITPPPLPLERHARGERVHTAKLTSAQVQAIRATYRQGTLNTYQLAEVYGVSPSAIQSLIRGRTWSHVA